MSNGGAKGTLQAGANGGTATNGMNINNGFNPPSLYSDPEPGGGFNPKPPGFPVSPPYSDPAPGGGSNPTPPPGPTFTGVSQQRAPSIFNSAAQGINDATAGARNEMNYVPSNINSQGYLSDRAQAMGYRGAKTLGAGYNAAGSVGRGYTAAGTAGEGYQAAGASGRGFGAADVNSQGYAPTTARAFGVNAGFLGNGPVVGSNDVTAGSIADSDIGRYMNPYTEQVVNRSLGDLDEARRLQMAQAGANATASGAFGGSRHALREAETNSSFFDQAARTSAGLRQQGFNQAQGMAQQDIANTMQADLANQGASLQSDTTTANLAQQRNLADQSADLRAKEFSSAALNQAEFANQAAQNQAGQFQAAAANQAAQQASAQQQQARQFGAQAGNVADLANQSSLNQARQFGSQARNTAGLANQSALNSAGQFGAQALNNASMANQAALNQAGQFGAAAGNTARLANQASSNQGQQFSYGARNTADLANQAANNRAREFNIGQNQSAQMANQAAGLAGSQQRLSAGNQLGNLSNLGFGMGQQLTGNLSQDGAMKQGLNQLLIDAVKNQFNQRSQAPYQSIGLLSQALGASPVPQTTTTSKQPGLFDYLTLAAGM